MLWFAEPFAAPPAFVNRAAGAGRDLGARLANEPPWVRRRFGVDGPAASAAALERLALALRLLACPPDTARAPHAESRELCELQDTVLSACLSALEEAPPPWEEREARARSVLCDLQRAALEPKKPVE